MAQLHKNFTDSGVKELIERYLRKEIKRKYIQQILGIGKTRFFALVSKYRNDSEGFSIQYDRKSKTRAIDPAIEKNIVKELKTDKKLIMNKDTALKTYNYSFIKKQIEKKYKQVVSLPTIIDRAKRDGFYLKKPKKKAHDREVITNYAGELIQHDSSQHLFAPDSEKKWYLITSIDDFSRFMLYAKLFKKETSLAHIQALQSVFLNYGVPVRFYADSHSIFRFVQGRDSLWHKHNKLTDDVDTQWKQVLNDCNVEYIPALSPQAKGKVERPYRWIQDHLVRLCARESVTILASAQRILNQEVHEYNYRKVHSTTKEVPYFRYQRALKNKKTLFRQFVVKPPYKLVKDIFCLRTDRKVNPYRKILLDRVELRIDKAPIGAKVNLRVYPNEKTGLSDIRFWHNNTFLGSQIVKNKDINRVFTFNS